MSGASSRPWDRVSGAHWLRCKYGAHGVENKQKEVEFRGSKKLLRSFTPELNTLLSVVYSFSNGDYITKGKLHSMMICEGQNTFFSSALLSLRKCFCCWFLASSRLLIAVH